MLQKSISCWSKIYENWVWLLLQLIHLSLILGKSEFLPRGWTDRIIWYFYNEWRVVLVLALLKIPVILFSVLSRNWQPDPQLNSNQRNNELQERTFSSESFVNENVILDTNVWMSSKLDIFFRALKNKFKKSSIKLVLFGPQFDELCNIKDRESYGSKRGRLARMALNRIEVFQKEGVLRIDPLSVQASPKAYADPLILKLIQELASEGKQVTFVSDDRELRIRAREIASDLQGGVFVCNSNKLK
jgi:rRNA-processing protein FCF1